MGQRFEAAFLRCRACARLLERLSVARAAAALCAALLSVGKVHASLLLASAFPSHLLFPAGEVVEAAYDVLFSCFLVSLHAASSACRRARSQNDCSAGFFFSFIDPSWLSACAPYEFAATTLHWHPDLLLHPPQCSTHLSVQPGDYAIDATQPAPYQHASQHRIHARTRLQRRHGSRAVA